MYAYLSCQACGLAYQYLGGSQNGDLKTMSVASMAGHLIRRLNQLSTHVFQTRLQQSGYDLTPVQFAAMDVLRATPGLDQASIAAQIAYDRATIGGVIDRLEQKGYVSRTISKRDRRAREVILTNEGRLVYDEVFQIVSTLQDDILAGLDAAEKHTFLRLAQKAIFGAGDKASRETTNAIRF